MSKGKKNIYFDYFIIETPEGEKHYIHPVNVYSMDYRREQRQMEQWYQQFVNIAPKINGMVDFIKSGFSPAKFIKMLKKKGFKVYWLHKEHRKENMSRPHSSDFVTKMRIITSGRR